MIVNDYFVVRVNTGETKYVKDMITAEDAVHSAFNELALYNNSTGLNYFLDAVSGNNRYLVIKMEKVYFVSTGKYDSYEIKAIRSDRKSAEDYMKQFPDECEFNKIEEWILDDPRDMKRGVPEDKNIYFVIVFEDPHLIQFEECWKTISNVLDIGKVRGYGNIGNHCVYVLGKDEAEAVEEAKRLCQQHKEREKSKNDDI